ncbi:MAG: deoxyribose-phosphate aldolase [Planctomycetota bacterium]|jgi:deoxyribose-phosphate aldolase
MAVKRVKGGFGPVADVEGLTPQALAACIDHTHLKAHAMPKKIRQVCDEAHEWGFAAVCVNPVHVNLAAEFLESSPVAVCTVVGFPLGASRADVKAFEAAKAVDDGADEIDMVINVGSLRAGEEEAVLADIRGVVEASEGRWVKVILETCYLTDEQIEKACTLCAGAGAHFAKTATGFGAFGAFDRHVRLMRETVGDALGVKASGGIGDFREALRMLKAGASRLGVSASIPIVEGFQMLRYTKGWLAEEIPCRICPSRAASLSKLPKEVYLYYKKACLECPHKAYNKFYD